MDIKGPLKFFIKVYVVGAICDGILFFAGGRQIAMDGKREY